jgi:sugar-specific transcriptional regulator TrmB
VTANARLEKTGIASLIIAAIVSSDVAVFFLQNFIFGKRIKKLEQKLEQDNETFRYKFHKQQNVENALVDAMNDLDRELVKIDGWLDRKIRLNLVDDFHGRLSKKIDVLGETLGEQYILNDDIRKEAARATMSYISAGCVGGILIALINDLDKNSEEALRGKFQDYYAEACKRLGAIKELRRSKLGVGGEQIS